jgi:hypothetical protein
MFRNTIWNIVVFVGVSAFLVLSILIYTNPAYVYNRYLARVRIQQEEIKQIKIPSDHLQENKKLKSHEKQKSKSKPELKHILYWNEQHGSYKYGFCCGRGPFKKYKCAYDGCFTSKDRTDDLSTFDAIVFHGRHLNKTDLPTKR